MEYRRGGRSALPFDDDRADAVICAWAILAPVEAARVLKPGGVLVQMACSPGWIAGELTPVLVTYVAETESPALSASIFGMEAGSATIDLTAAPRDTTRPEPDWDGVPTVDGVHDHDFAYLADYESAELAETILGRIYGPAVGDYIRDRRQPTIAWSLRITWARVAKQRTGLPLFDVALTACRHSERIQPRRGSSAVVAGQDSAVLSQVVVP